MVLVVLDHMSAANVSALLLIEVDRQCKDVLAVTDGTLLLGEEIKCEKTRKTLSSC